MVVDINAKMLMPVVLLVVDCASDALKWWFPEEHSFHDPPTVEEFVTPLVHTELAVLTWNF